MAIPVLIYIAGMIMLAVFLKQRISKGCCATATVLKSIVSILFLFTAFSSFALKEYSSKDKLYCILIFAALIFSLLGDVFLDEKYAHRDSEKVYTYAGFLMFLSAHTVYNIALISRFYIKGHILYVIIPVVFSLIFAPLMYFSEDLLQVKYGEYKKIVSLYSPFIMSIMAVSFSMALLNGFKVPALNMFLAGTALFEFSDFILNGTYFGQGKNRPVDVILNHVSYYIAQFTFAISLFYLN